MTRQTGGALVALYTLVTAACGGYIDTGNFNQQQDECGDGIVAPHEACDDGNRVDGDGCSADCLSVESSVCGNNVIESHQDEKRDGVDLAGYDCGDLGFSGGTLVCDSNCFFDTEYCQ